MPVADRDEGPHKAPPVRRRVPSAGPRLASGDDRPAPRRPMPSSQCPIAGTPAPPPDGTPTGPGLPTRRSVPAADAQALRPRRTRRHRRAHRHEPRPSSSSASSAGRSSAARSSAAPARSKCCPTATASCAVQPHNYLASPGRHLRLAEPDSPPGPEDRPGRRGADPPADRGPGQLRPDAGRTGQRHLAGGDGQRHQLRGPDAAASRTPASSSKPTGEELIGPRRRSGHADRQGPARPDRVAAACRQDRAACKRSPWPF